MKTLLTIVAVMLIAGPVMADWDDVHVADANTRGLWHFNETAGTDFADESSYGNNGTFLNGSAYERTALSWQPSEVPLAGFGNEADAAWNPSELRSYGAMAVAQSAVNDSLFFDNNTDQTIEFWANNEFGAETGYYRFLISSQLTRNYSIYLTQGLLHFQYDTPGGGWVDVVGDTQLTGTTMHVAVCIDRSSSALQNQVAFFFNGVIDSNGWQTVAKGEGNHHDSNGDLDPLNDPFYIGGNYSLGQNSTFFGMMDEVRISDVVRYPIPEPSMMLLALGALAFWRKK
jgi:Concanavalin A-like lectin/glucanases superfamily